MVGVGGALAGDHGAAFLAAMNKVGEKTLVKSPPLLLCQPLMRRGGRVVEGARLESVYMPKAYQGFESLSLRQVFWWV